MEYNSVFDSWKEQKAWKLLQIERSKLLLYSEKVRNVL